MARSWKNKELAAAGRYVHRRTSVVLPEEMHQQIRAFMVRHEVQSFSEAVMRLIDEGLGLEKIEPKKWKESDFVFDSNGTTVTINFPKEMYEKWRDWRFKHKLDTTREAVIALVGRALEEEENARWCWR